MPHKEQEDQAKLNKFLIPLCIALPFNLVLLKDPDSENCTAVTEDGECRHAKGRYHIKGKFKCDKNTLIPLGSKQLA
jgi:hypothetical protein